MHANIIYMDIMSVLLLLLIIMHSKQTRQLSFSSAILTRIMWLSVIGIFSDLLFSKIDGVSGFFFLFCNEISMILYFASLCFSAYLWLQYIYIEIGKPWKNTKRSKFLINAPIILMLILILSSPITGWIFSFDAQNKYIRGSLYLLQPPLTFSYIFYGVWLSFCNYKKAELPDNRRYYLNLTYYIMIPIIGGSIQALFYGTNYLMPAIALSLTMLYLDNIRRTVSLDPLTQLNNRGQFDSYLKKSIENETRAANLHLIFLDINKFKSINDTYGHLEGDHAITVFAYTLKQVFADTKAFLARYGGDEFAVILFCSEEELDYYILRIQQKLEETSKTLPYNLSTSFGIAHYNPNTMKNTDDFIKVADDQMYQQKQNNKRI